VQHGRFHLQKGVADHELADAVRAWLRSTKRGARLVGHQVDIALAVLDLLVVHAVELVGQRAQALGQQAHLVGVDGQLAGAGLEQHAFGGHDVAQVPVLEHRVQGFAHAVVVQVDLDAATAGPSERPAGWQNWPCPSRA
jgi:hypothetical protein